MSKEKENKGLMCDIYESKSIGNCSAGGISEQCKEVVLIWDGCPEIFASREGMPAVKLVKRELWGKEYLHCEPIQRRSGVGPMMGGTFVYSCDSRFPSKYPIPLHDRWESHKVYDAMSR